MTTGHDGDIQHLEHAARIALRGHGRVEPNPMVGSVVLDAKGAVIGEGHHARCGEAHAERIALSRAGSASRGGTLYCTLEPCAHQGRTPPCTDAILESGLKRVVFGTLDPNATASGGAELIRSAGIDVRHLPTEATEVLNAPYVHRIRTGLPWMIAKWAQTIDGRIATAGGDSRWISSDRSRRLVHRERGRVDAVMTGIGTLLADNPRLTPRQTRSPRRIPERIVVDGALQTPIDCTLVTTANEVPTIILCHPGASDGPHGALLRERGVVLEHFQSDEDLPETMRRLRARRGHDNILVEAGGGLLGRLFKQDLVNDALVFIAPKMLGDQQAPGSVRGRSPERIADSIELEPITAFPREDDVIAWYRTPRSG
jgi:diaminohydroxyphosphoribosylaminopyrimidine deaminase/5-amino-6-(5-phosphoribosylamino)uracil reductase